MFYKAVLLLALVIVSTKGGTLFDPCKKNDLKCLTQATESFISKTYGGFLNFGIQQIDPLIIPSMDIDLDNYIGMALYFKGLNVTGLKSLKTIDFKMNTDKKSVVLKMTADLKLDSELELKFTKTQRKYKGHYSGFASVVETSKYYYELKTINKTEYFEVGPEVNSCEISEEPVVSINKELLSSLDKDTHASTLKQKYADNQVIVRKKIFCKIANIAFKTVISNLRAVASYFPKSHFFEDVN